MARKDRVFTAKDIIRLIDKNLLPNQRVKVIIALCEGIKIERFDDIPILVPQLAREAGIEDLDVIEALIKLILKVFGR